MALGTVVVTCTVLVLILYWRKMYAQLQERRKLIRDMRKFPGPLSIPLLGTTWQFKWNIEGLTLQFLEWSRYYAKQGHGLVQIWLGIRPVVMCIRPETAKLVLERTDIITKGDEYNILLPWLGTGLLISTGEKWRSRRKLLTPTFHFKVLNDFIPIYDHQAQIFVRQLESFVASGEEVDLFPYLKRCALDIICETAMGFRLGAQENHAHPYVYSVKRLNELAFLHERMPWMWINAVWYLSTFGFEYDRHLKIVTDFSRKVIKDRISEHNDEVSSKTDKKKAFLDLLIDVQAEGNLSYEDIREEVDTFMFEGHDTTSSGMGWTLWFMAVHPEYQVKVQQELDEIFGSSDRSCTSEDLSKMKYLEKCIKESLRVRPPVPMMTRKVEQDIEIGDTTIPKGCSIMISAGVIHTNPTVYENPYRFDPERFSDDAVQQRHPYAFIPFSAGPRNCIGQKFAMFVEKTVLSWFFRRFSISTLIPPENNVALPEVILKPSLGFPCIISSR